MEIMSQSRVKKMVGYLSVFSVWICSREYPQGKNVKE